MSFATTYRPTNLDQIIGHETHVTRLRGIVSLSDKPAKKAGKGSSLFFCGPTSAGKTTLARAFAADVNGLQTSVGSTDYKEVNGSSDRNIDDVRELTKISKFKPRTKKRIILVDEAQGFLQNAQAANALLKPLEEPSTDTLWILCSMEPAKFQASQTGRAILNRCSQFVLEPHTSSDLLKFASRIAKAEDMKYVIDEEKTVLKAVVRASQEMRTLAGTMEALQQYYEGLKDKPKKLTTDHVQAALRSTESADEQLAVTVLTGVYNGAFSMVQRSLLDVQDGFMFVNKLMWAHQYVLNTTILKGERHRKVWANATNKAVMAAATKAKMNLGQLAAINDALITVKVQAMSFGVSPEDILSSQLYKLIKELFVTKSTKSE